MKQKNKLITVILLSVLSVNCVFAQTEDYKIKKDSITGKYQYQEVFNLVNTTKEEIYKRVKSNYIKFEKTIQYDENPSKIVIRYQYRLSTFKYGIISETFDIKDNKIRWTLSDLGYLFAVTDLSKWKNVEDTNDNSAIEWWNKLLPKSRNYFKEKIIDISKSDW